MNECIIVFRNPGNDRVGFIAKDDDSGDPEVFPHHDAAVEFALKHSLLQAWPFQIVELDEL